MAAFAGRGLTRVIIYDNMRAMKKKKQEMDKPIVAPMKKTIESIGLKLHFIKGLIEGRCLNVCLALRK